MEDFQNQFLSDDTNLSEYFKVLMPSKIFLTLKT